ncbi:hypothetical protein BDY19DRAFT_516139 [Irpex rosettiformis]|uniref:Uncharacterized protein n=1 Tax=Irpex rosettiformis TaxID=378272 RepID=A0ACB8TS74_9APHY|nr:hypothetical protein BDY19DRAFT_516139 [Irpex rosettiformis]
MIWVIPLPPSSLQPTPPFLVAFFVFFFILFHLRSRPQCMDELTSKANPHPYSWDDDLGIHTGSPRLSRQPSAKVLRERELASSSRPEEFSPLELCQRGRCSCIVHKGAVITIGAMMNLNQLRLHHVHYIISGLTSVATRLC